MEPRYDPERNRPLMGAAKQLTNEDGRILSRVYCSGEKLDSKSWSPFLLETRLNLFFKFLASCSDSSSSCSYWQSQGFCDPKSQYANYVRERCRYSCRICKLVIVFASSLLIEAFFFLFSHRLLRALIWTNAVHIGRKVVIVIIENISNICEPIVERHVGFVDFIVG